jgi:hypothetical protein
MHRHSRLRFWCLFTVVGLISTATQAFGPFPEATSVFVDASNPSAGDGSEANPFASLQAGVDAALPGDRVGAAPGIYPESVLLAPGVELAGSGREQSVIEPPAGELAVEMATNSTLAGFLVRNATPRGSAVVARDAANVTIRDNEFVENDSQAILGFQSSGEILRNRIVANPEFTGFPTYCPCDGIQLTQSAFRVAENELDGSDRNGNLNAIYVSYINPEMTESFLIERNRILGRIQLSSIDARADLENVIRDNLILSGNGFSSAINVAFSEQAGSIVNNTLIGGSGIFTQGTTIAAIENNVIALGRTGINDSGLASVIRNNNVFGNGQNYTGDDLTGIDGNISEDPLFVDRDALDYRLGPGSPAIDAGSNAASGVSDSDFEGGPRIVDGDGDGTAVIDMGAFEAPADGREEGRIDIAPWRPDNRIRVGSRVPLPVAILGSEAVSVASIDRDNLAFGPGGAPSLLDLTHPLVFFLSLRDVDGDDIPDFLAWFDVTEAGLTIGMEEACLEWSVEGRPFRGCDDIETEPRCGLGAELALVLPPLMWLWRRRRRGG